MGWRVRPRACDGRPSIAQTRMHILNPSLLSTGGEDSGRARSLEAAPVRQKDAAIWSISVLQAPPATQCTGSTPVGVGNRACLSRGPTATLT